jgi:alpha-galactosidase
LKSLAEKILRNEIVSSRAKEQESYTDKILHEKVRYEILKRFGYFVTESSEHFAEYVPWFIKKNRQDLIDKYKIPIDEYIDRCELYIKMWKKFDDDITPIANEPIKRSNEYASYIIDAITNNNKVIINANIMNNNLIDNLPSDSCVEVPCEISAKGIKPQRIGKLPTHLAGLMKTNINVQLLTAEAAISKRKETIYHAAMLDPLTASLLSIDEIYKMVDELLIAHQDLIPKYY